MSIKSKAINSGKWVTISTAAQTIIQFVQMAVLARILDSTAFGVVSMSLIFINFFGIFSDLGFTNSIIHKQESDQKILSSVYYTSILVAVVLSSLAMILSPFVAEFYHEPRLGKVVVRMAFCFVIICFGSIYAILLKKELQFKAIAAIDITGNAVAFVVTIILALRGFNELSIVYGTLTVHVIRSSLEIYFGRHIFKPKWHFKFGEIKDHLKFGVYNLGETFVGFIQGNWDNIIVGRILGARYLGIYNLALQLGYYPISRLNPLILRVAFPLIAKFKDDDSALKRAYIKILDILSYFNYPLLAGLFITVQSVVPLACGPNWAETFPLIKIFVFVSAVTCLSHPLFTIAYTKGKPKYLFYIGLVSFIIKIPLVLVLGKYWGVTGIAIALLLTESITLIINLTLVRSLIGNFMKPFLQNILKPITFCLIMVLAVYLYQVIFGYQGIYHTIAQVLIGAGVYLALTFKFKYSFSDLIEIKNSL
ncbi:MAG TPA: MOP flippase family protein [Mucilaginibacter sp.]|jgi:PST family polysaccharide transporter/lipopolysaccharide exporter|nr:MOP flippase family protein [Mucilaginibacter sp.]